MARRCWGGRRATAVPAGPGVVIPLGVEVADLTNFAGYVGWCLWLIALSVVLWRTDADRPVRVSATA